MTNVIASVIIAFLMAVNIAIILNILIRDIKINKDRLLLYVAGACVSVLGWQIVYLIFFLTSDVGIMRFTYDFKLTFVAFSSFFIIMTVLRFYRIDYYFTKTIIMIMLIIPFFTLIYSSFATGSNLIRESFSVMQIYPIHEVITTRGVWFWIHTISCYMFLFGAFITSLYCHNKLPRTYRMPSYILLIGLLLVVSINMLQITGVNYQNFDTSIVGISVAVTVVYFSVSNSKGVDFIASARDEIYDFLSTGIMVLNDERYVVYINKSAWARFAELGMNAMNELYDTVFEYVVGKAINIEAAPADEDGLDMKFVRKGNEVIYNLREKPIKDNSDIPIGTFIEIEEVTNNRAIISKLENIGGIDALTGLANRRSMEKFMTNTDNSDKLPIVVISGDINGLKEVNDKLGHKQGDVLIRLVSEIMTDVCPPKGRVSRIGGDEFLIVIPNSNEKEAEETILQMENLMEKNKDFLFRPSVSFGYSLKKDENQDLIEVVSSADKKMYETKVSKKEGIRKDGINNMDLKHETNCVYIIDKDDKRIAEITFPDVEEGLVDIDHTFVDSVLRGQGIAGKLVDAAYNNIKEQNKKAVLTCPYAVKWFDQHPEKNDIVKK